MIARLLQDLDIYVKDCCFGRGIVSGLKHTQCGATLKIYECTHQQHVASQQPKVAMCNEIFFECQ